MIRMSVTQRRQMIEQSALSIARSRGIPAVTMRSVADGCPEQTSPGTVRRYFPRLTDLRMVTVDMDDTLREEAVALGLCRD